MRWRPFTEREPPNAGDFSATFLPHLDAAHNLARWLVRDRVLAEDVVQDAFVRAIGHFDGFRGGDPRAWLLQIVRNTAFTVLATRQRRPAESLDGSGENSPALQIADTAPDPETRLSGQESAAGLQRALAALPIELRECLVLRELEDLSYRQIAVVVGVPVGTVMSRLWRARQALTSAAQKELAA